MRCYKRPPQIPRERLKQIARYGASGSPDIAGPRVSIAVALLLLILAMLAIAFLGGWGAAEIFRAHAEQIKHLAAQLWL